MESVAILARVSGYLLRSPRMKATQNSSGAATETSSSSSTSANTQDSDWKITVREGELVEKGTPLFLIDPKPYQLALDQSLGSLKASQARLTQANQDLSRSKELRGREAASEAEYDQAVAAVAELRGQIENLKATSERNLLDLNYTQVASPIDGLLGSTMVTEGNLVVADSTVLTTVVSVNPIYVDFNVDEQSVLDYRRRIVTGEVKSARDAKIEIAMGLVNEDGYPHKGTIDFVDNRTDPNTGNTRMRGIFDNPSGILSPGLFARVQTPFTEPYEAVLVPSPAIAMDQQGRYVMVVGADNKATRRSVQLGQLIGDQTVIAEGVDAGEKVIISGLQKVRSGDPVTIDEKARAAADNAAASDESGTAKDENAPVSVEKDTTSDAPAAEATTDAAGASQ